MSNKNVTSIPGIHGEITIARVTRGGFPKISAQEESDLYYGLGYAHGRDRQMNMWLMKLIGTGTASEYLSSSDDLIAVDRFMRWVDLAGKARQEVAELSGHLLDFLQIYCQGVNQAVADNRTPFEFRLLGYKPDAWTPVDVFIMAQMIGFIGLSQSQGDNEKFIMQMIQHDIPPEKIKELFPAIQEDITQELIDIVNQIHLVTPPLPNTTPWKKYLPSFSASNNWVVSPERSASGSAILCGDPHLQLQLPSIWYLAELSSPNHYLVGATVPGAPVFGLGRTHDLAWSVTYGTADISDYFIEQVEDGKYRRGDDWLPLKIREEILRPKGKDPIHMRVYESEHGILEGEANKSGYYLAYAWSAKQHSQSGTESLANFIQIPHTKTVQQAIDHFAGLAFAPFNWVLGDSSGNIGYQLSGLFPRKASGSSGLLPYFGWDPTQDWQGIHAPQDLPRAINPPEGYLVTANNDLNHLGLVKPMTLPGASYRADRISQLISQKPKLTVEDMQEIHYDRYSIQAEHFMQIIRPLLPETKRAEYLRTWDLRYEVDSYGATDFERVYHALLVLVFGENGLGQEAMRELITSTGVFAMIYGNFDHILLGDSSAWFGENSHRDLYRRAIEMALSTEPTKHGDTSKLWVNNLLFEGKLPKFLGFDYHLTLIGSRATIPQAQVYSVAGRSTNFAPSVRIVCDFSTDELHTNIAGGASDRRFSKYYTAGWEEWEQGIYDTFSPTIQPKPEQTPAE
jgi:penicillin amidase